MASPELTFIFAGIIAFGIFMYVLLDGFDLGIGILFPLAPAHEDRDLMMNTVAPIWDGNETWLVLGGATLFGAFPLAYAIVLPAAYLPIMVMLFALVFRGVAFEFRFKAKTSRGWWDFAFAGGSTVAALAQGIVLGSFVQGYRVVDGAYAGGPFDWLTPFSLLTGVAVIAGYALLGATWLIWRTEGALQIWAYGVARTTLVLVLFFLLAVSLWTPFTEPAIAERWFGDLGRFLLLAPVPLLTGLAALALWRAIGQRRDLQPFLYAIAIFLFSFIGLGVSLWPYAVPRAVTIWDAASPAKSQSFLLVGVAIMLPIILAYSFHAYWVFRGKLKRGEGYSH
jgi:cytochrome d ubiquinol oxidase subunit II